MKNGRYAINEMKHSFIEYPPNGIEIIEDEVIPLKPPIGRATVWVYSYPDGVVETLTLRKPFKK